MKIRKTEFVVFSALIFQMISLRFYVNNRLWCVFIVGKNYVYYWRKELSVTCWEAVHTIRQFL
jgi:hypothetical protein